MHLVPRVDLAGGESRFSLVNPNDPDRPFEDPAEVALAFQEMGARRIQVIDVDRATEHGDNDDQLVRVLDRVGVPVEAGGGVRSMRRIQELLDSGVGRVVLSTMGLEHEDWLKEVGICFGDRVVQSIDLCGGKILTKGRSEAKEVGLAEFAARVDGFGMGGILVTACDESPPDVDLAAVRGLAQSLRSDVWLGGSAATTALLDSVRSSRIAGVVLGRELYDGRLDLAEAIKRYAPAPTTR